MSRLRKVRLRHSTVGGLASSAIPRNLLVLQDRLSAAKPITFTAGDGFRCAQPIRICEIQVSTFGNAPMVVSEVRIMSGNDVYFANDVRFFGHFGQSKSLFLQVSLSETVK